VRQHCSCVSSSAAASSRKESSMTCLLAWPWSGLCRGVRPVRPL
jgi:hypothetical protein